MAFQGLDNLSLREREIAALVAKGLSNKEIADRLYITEKTVKYHTTNIYRLVGVTSRAQLIVGILKHYPTDYEIDLLLNGLGYHG